MQTKFKSKLWLFSKFEMGLLAMIVIIILIIAIIVITTRTSIGDYALNSRGEVEGFVGFLCVKLMSSNYILFYKYKYL